MRTFLALVGGYLAWTALWLLGNALFSSSGLVAADAGGTVHDLGSLGWLLVLSQLCSLTAGYLWGLIDKKAGRTWLALAGALFATGAIVQWGQRDSFPLWYHVSFLVLLFPITWLGVRLRKS